jgi:hypothetical protein
MTTWTKKSLASKTEMRDYKSEFQKEKERKKSE